MKLSVVFGAAAAALSLTGACWAQPSTSSAPDPVRLQLAHQLIESSGGVESYKARLQSMVAGLRKMMIGLVPPDASDVTNAMFKYVVDEEVNAAPEMMDDAATVYARHLSASELRAYIAWISSDAGRSIQEKGPAITEDIMEMQRPFLQRLLPAMLQHSLDKACADTHCTPEQQKQLVAMIASVAGPGQDSGAPTASSSN